MVFILSPLPVANGFIFLGYYIVFDKNMVYQTAGWQRVSTAAAFNPGQEVIAMNPGVGFEQVKFNAPITITADGYIYVWVSNESENTKVWFDDLTVTHTQNLITQATDYGVWGDLVREQRVDESTYRYGYQGQFAEKDEETGWNHFELREYDPLIGRFTSVDPAGQFWSPYIGMGNDPVSGVDPTGGCTDSNGNPIPCPAFMDEATNVNTTILGEVAVMPDNPTPWQVGAEWLTGMGPRDRAFMDGDIFTKMLKQHSHVEETRNIIKNTLANGGEFKFPGADKNGYDLSGIEGVPKYLKDYSTLATGGATGNLAVTYLGSYTLTYKIEAADIANRTATVHFSINNSSTIQSATRPPVLGYTAWWRNNIGNSLNDALKSGPMSTTTQTFDWTETIKY